MSQVIPAFYDQGAVVMNHRTGTPMRLVSPAPVLVPPGPRPPQAPPTIYQPPQPQATQQNIYSQQNNTSVGGKIFQFSNLFFNLIFFSLVL